MKDKMKQVQVYIDQEKQEQLITVALKNSIKPTNQNLTTLAYDIACQVVENLDSDDLEQVTNFKFK